MYPLTASLFKLTRTCFCSFPLPPSPTGSSFDLVTNGGIAVALHFERAPFITQEHTLWLPWGRFFVMDTIVMRHEENDIPGCDLSSFTRPSPVVSPAPLTAFAGSCAERRTVVPEIQVTRQRHLRDTFRFWFQVVGRQKKPKKARNLKAGAIK